MMWLSDFFSFLSFFLGFICVNVYHGSVKMLAICFRVRFFSAVFLLVVAPEFIFTHTLGHTSLKSIIF